MSATVNDQMISPEQLQGELTESGNTVVLGRPYVSYYVFRYPPWPGMGFLNSFVLPALLGLKGWGGIFSKLFNPQNDTLAVDSAGFISPADLASGADSLPFKVPPEFKAGRGKPWAIVVQWRKIADAGGGPNEAGVDTIVKSIAVLGLAVLGYMTFRAFTKAAGEIRELATETVFSPGFIIAALVAIALIFGGIGGGLRK